MNLEETINQCPKAHAALKQHIIKGLQEMQKAMIPPDAQEGEFELPDLNTFLTDEMIMHTLKSNVRVLYDFFDMNKIYVTIGFINSNWIYQIDSLVGPGFNSRFEAELEGFASAFKTLEEKL